MKKSKLPVYVWLGVGNKQNSYAVRGYPLLEGCGRVGYFFQKRIGRYSNKLVTTLPSLAYLNGTPCTVKEWKKDNAGYI